jgi:type IV secretion system protein VirB9
MHAMNDERGRSTVGRLFLVSALALHALLYSLEPRAELAPSRGVVDGRVRMTIYDSEQVYRLRGFVGYQIDLEFEPGETFVGLGAGDIDGLSYFGQGNHLFLKPKATKVATNITVLTNRRHYQFDYAVLSQRPTKEDPDVVFALRFSYPMSPSQSAAANAARLIDADLGTASTRQPRNFDYWYCGVPALRPIAGSDDGIHTRLRFAANAELPAIFLRNEDDSESLVNSSMENGDVVIHRVGRRFILRRGKLTGCVVNKGFAGAGVRLDSGTVTPDVERRVQGGQP